MANSYAIIHIDSHNPYNKVYDTPKVQLRLFSYEGAFASSIHDEEEISMETLYKFMKPNYLGGKNLYEPNKDNSWYHTKVRNPQNGEILWNKIDTHALIEYYKEYYMGKYPNLKIQ